MYNMFFLLYGGIMDFTPMNRHLYVIPVSEEEEEMDSLSIIMPDDFQKPEDPYVVCDVIGIAEDCDISLDIGDRVVIENRMLHQIIVNGETIYIVLQNYVYGRIDNEDNY